MIHCDTADQFLLCQWVLVNFEESTVRMELVSDNQIRVYAVDGFMDVYMNMTRMIDFECHMYSEQKKEQDINS